MSKIFYFIPGVQCWKMLIRAWKRKLYSQTTIHIAPSVSTTRCSDRTILIIKADITRSRLTWAWSTSISFPVQVLQPALLKLKYLLPPNSISFIIMFNFFLVGIRHRLVWLLTKPTTCLVSTLQLPNFEPYQGETRHYECAISNKCRLRPCSVLSSSKSHHVTTKSILKIARH